MAESNGFRAFLLGASQVHVSWDPQRGKAMVSKATGKQLTAEDMAHLFPCPKDPEAISPLCLHQATKGVMFDLRYNIDAWAILYHVPSDMVTEMVLDQLVSEKMGVEPTPAIFFIPEE
jgi:hypothetical protein